MIHIEKIKHHLEHLKEKHNDLEKQIKESFNHYDSDETVKKLKLDKLKLKHEIDECERKLAVGSVVAIEQTS